MTVMVPGQQVIGRTKGKRCFYGFAQQKESLNTYAQRTQQNTTCKEVVWEVFRVSFCFTRALNYISQCLFGWHTQKLTRAAFVGMCLCVT